MTKYILLCCSLIACISCNDHSELDNLASVKEGIPVTLKLNYKALVADEVTSRATDAEEKQLSELHVLVFSANGDGKLKGYKKITEGLKQDGTRGDFTILTTTGDCYIYGIANTSATYYQAEDFIDASWTEAGAQNGNYDLTRTAFLQKSYHVSPAPDGKVEDIYIANGLLTMSGSMNEGKPFSITANADGTTANVSIPDPTIYLKRVVSKVNFTFGVTTNPPNPVFKLTKYDICNVPQTIPLLEGGGLPEGTTVEYTDIRGIMPGTQEANQIKDIYLPENLGTAQGLNAWKDREANRYTTDGGKRFTNAPEKSTYIIAYGEYTDNTGKIANVEYTIHLGDFTANYNDFNNLRNCKYTYNITVHGVNDIIAEATKDENENPWNPATEGLVLDPTGGKVYTLDSHYESCVMRFSQADIQELAESELGGYVFQVETFGQKSEIFVVNNSWDDTKLGSTDLGWVSFAIGGDYNGENEKGGRPITYTSTKKNDGSKELYTVPELLQYLRSIRNKDDAWTGEGQTLTVTCFVDENYYQAKSWDEYTNIPPRILYIANDVAVSDDGKSIYAKVAYGFQQYAIQTIYNPALAGSLIAYGCETINDEEGREAQMVATDVHANNGNRSNWDGRTNMKIDMGWNANSAWNKYYDGLYHAPINNLYEACMSRNRDLNRNGVIDDDEIRWYTPTLAQYTGLWIGEEALATYARLYTGNTQEIVFLGQAPWISAGAKHYYTSSSGNQRTYWSEEAMSNGGLGDGLPKYVRCIRTLASGNNGMNVVPDEYYTRTVGTYRFDLNHLNPVAVRTGAAMTGELTPHVERSTYNRPYQNFTVAPARANGTWTMNVIKDSQQTPCYTYGEGNGTWRIPNQRELCLITLEQLKNSNGDVTLAQGDDVCRTGFSGEKPELDRLTRIGYSFAGDRLRMLDGSEDNDDDYHHVRCVRDTPQ